MQRQRARLRAPLRRIHCCYPTSDRGFVRFHKKLNVQTPSEDINVEGQINEFLSKLIFLPKVSIRHEDTVPSKSYEFRSLSGVLTKRISNVADCRSTSRSYRRAFIAAIEPTSDSTKN